MARRPSTTLTDAELRLMKVLWDRRQATVNDVLTALPERGRPAYSTVLTTLRILERKGYLRHRKEGRSHRYAPIVDRDTATRSAVRHLMERFFDSSPRRLALSLLENGNLDEEDLADLRRLLDEPGED